RKHGPDDVPQLLLGCGSHALHGPELLDEFPGRLLADALDLAKLGMKRAPRSLFPLQRNGEPVRLVSCTLQQLERRARFGDVDRILVTGVVDLLWLLRKADDGEFAVGTKVAQGLHGGRGLPFAAIDHAEVGPGPIFRGDLPIPARDNLPHGQEIIRFAIRSLADLVVPVRALLWPAVDEHYARGHRACASEVRDVEALDMPRQVLESQILLELLDGE